MTEHSADTVERMARAIIKVFTQAGYLVDGAVAVYAARAALSALTVEDATKVSDEDRENIVDEIESIICETHEMDVRDMDYAENIVSWMEKHHPAALRAIADTPKECE